MNENRPELIETYPDEQPILLSHVASTLRRYRVVIALSMAVVVVLCLLAAACLYLFSYSQTIASLPFQLEFNGANIGEYPNGLKFSVADITVNPVLLEVYAANDLGRFVGFEKFSRAIYVLESNRGLEQLAAEYQARLSDPKLTPIDRERLEREFNDKSASMSRSGYAIQFLITDDTRRVPRSLVGKTLTEILAAWARRAAVEKRALDIQVPVLSTGILEQKEVESADRLIPLLLLRRRVDDVMGNLGTIAGIPGAQLVRSPKENVSIEELRLSLDEIFRFRIEPLITTARSTGQIGSTAIALQVLHGQLAYDERLLTGANMREEAFRNALLTYDSQPSGTSRAPAGSTTPGTPVTPLGRPNGETVMPQLSESFLDRIVDLTKSNADRAYRQRLNEEIKAAALAIIPLEQTVRYDRELIDAFQKAPGHTDPAAVATLNREWQIVLTQMRRIVSQMNEIYQLASRQLNPSTEMYRITSPIVFRVERTTSLTRLAVGSALAILIAIPLIIGGVLVHNRISEEEAMERHARAAEAIAS